MHSIFHQLSFPTPALCKSIVVSFFLTPEPEYWPLIRLLIHLRSLSLFLCLLLGFPLLALCSLLRCLALMFLALLLFLRFVLAVVVAISHRHVAFSVAVCCRLC